ncbi:hypothetical protein HY008_02705 [Candidatus Woesebacteria bacterium]|nr:hypothetical protein [Candidatus Woesebacteria bacterium]
MNKFLENTYQYLDWNYYFFAGHPRERVGVAEIEKLPWWLLPFFVSGLWSLPKDKKLLLKTGVWFLGGIFFLSLFGLTDNLTSFFIFPPIAVVIALGARKLYEKISFVTDPVCHCLGRFFKTLWTGIFGNGIFP